MLRYRNFRQIRARGLCAESAAEIRDIYDKYTSNAGVAEINVAKNKKGPTGIAELAFFGKNGRFANR